MPRRRRLALVFAGALAIVLAPGSAEAQEVGPGREPVPGGFGETIRVPQDESTIQGGVDAAEPGGLVLVSPGIYEESVTVRTPYLTIRGMDRNRTIVDGGFERTIGIEVIEADGVVVENLTSRNHTLSGFQWTSVHGYRGSYLTAYNNGDYGIFALASDWGQFDHSYASGSPDSGFYIGQCQPCHALITDVLAEHNALGYSGTNAGGDLAIVNSEWRSNVSGIVPNSMDSERLAPQRGALIAGNFVHDNNATTADANDLQYPTFGTGILIAGGESNQVIGNLVENHDSYGIAVLPNVDDSLWVTSDNQVRANLVTGSGRADLALGAPAAGGDCFDQNAFHTSAPPAIELLRGCGSFGARIGGGDPAPTVNLGTRFLDALDGEFPHGDWRTQPEPPPQPTMDNPETTPAVPAIPEQNVPERYRIRPVSRIDGVPVTVGKELTVFGLPLATSWWSLLIGLYGYALPGFLYAAWLTIALWDLIRQESVPISTRARWMAVVILVPFLGPLLYFAFGDSPIPKQLRLMLTAGGAAACLLVVAIAGLFGG